MVQVDVTCATRLKMPDSNKYRTVQGAKKNGFEDIHRFYCINFMRLLHVEWNAENYSMHVLPRAADCAA